MEEESQLRLEFLGNSLRKKLLDNIRLRHCIEQRWLDDLRQYHGRYDPATENRLNQAIKAGQAASNLYVNITRSKCETVESQIIDMLFPTDERNWDLKSTPMPLVEGVDPALAGQIAEERSKGMRKEIDDQLVEASYVAKMREVIHDCTKLGTGIIKGPIVINRTRKQWHQISGPTYELMMAAEHRPGLERIDPWDYVPDMSARNVHEAEFHFERRRFNAKTLRKLAKHPGYLPDQIRTVLRDQGRSYDSQTDTYMQERRQISDSLADTTRLPFEAWEYNGPIDKEDLRAAGVDIPEDDDPLIEYEGVIQFIGDTVIRVDLHPLDSDECMYSVINYISDDDTIFGFGEPYVLRSPQAAICTGWRMMLDNAGLSVGPQTVVDMTRITPMDNTWGLSARKLWRFSPKGPGDKISDFFNVFEVKSYQPELAAIIDRARELADAESNIPRVSQGEGDPNATTAYGTSMLLNSSRSTIRRFVKQFDDDITKPLIGRFYDWNMQYNPDPTIKGDFEVQPLGSSTLLVKETQTQQLMQFAAFYQNPVFQPALVKKSPAYLRKIVESMHISPSELVLTDEEIAAEEQQRQQQALQQQQQQADLAQQQATESQAQRDHEVAMQNMRQQHALDLQQKQQDNKQQIAHDNIIGNLARDELRSNTPRGIAGVNSGQH